ncbi:hypothetical protein BDF22DRAFT_739164 [Syncephalis plumigaleata]|nr:hypothetical protein BDF22DRAFT_739164 [Syncephalis plumigaleata]
MKDTPNDIIKYIALHVDTDTLIALAWVSKRVMSNVRELKAMWEKRYKERYSLLDINEMEWIKWYNRTLQASRLSVLGNRSTSRGDREIDWFIALYRRSAANANSFRNHPNQLKDVVEDASDDQRLVILQRVVYRSKKLRKCRVIEQCQPLGGTSHTRFWRSRKLCQTGIRSRWTVEDVVISGSFLVVFAREQLRSYSDHTKLTNLMFVWPVNCAAVAPPRQVSYPYKNAISIRNHWVLFFYDNLEVRKRERVSRSIRLVDIGTGQVIHHTVGLPTCITFIQQATDNTVTVIFGAVDQIDSIYEYRWSAWQFSVYSYDISCRSLARGSFFVKDYTKGQSLMERIDDDRVIFTYTTDVADDLPNNENDQERCTVTLAVLSIHYNSVDQYDNQQQQQPICIDTIHSLLRPRCSTTYSYYIADPSRYIPNYYLCLSPDHTSYIAVDLTYPERVGSQRITHLFDHANVTMGDSVQMENTCDSLHRMSYIRTPTNTQAKLRVILCSCNAWLVEHNDSFKILDLSIWL